MPHLYLCQADCYPLFLESCVVIFLDNFWIECHVKCQLPWWLLVSFGSYALWCLGWGLFTFRDCPEAYTELLGVSSSLMACLPLHLLATSYLRLSYGPSMFPHFIPLFVVWLCGLCSSSWLPLRTLPSRPTIAVWLRKWFPPSCRLFVCWWWCEFQEIKLAKDELRTQGVTVD